MRRAEVACRPSWRTAMASRVAMRPSNAPYVWGPSSRAATIVKPYVATLMMPIATAIDPPPPSREPRRDREITERSVVGRWAPGPLDARDYYSVAIWQGCLALGPFCRTV